MSNTTTRTTSTFPVGTVLTIIFVVLKLTHQIGWSWWWVLLPTWGPFALAAAFFLVFALAVGVSRALTR